MLHVPGAFLTNPTIAIVGGGLSGALLTVHLLRLARPGVRVVLIERAPAVGRGTAYGTGCEQHLLNVPAGRMSALPDAPDHFLDWVRARAGETGFPRQVEAGDFLPRRIYGDYVGALLSAAVRERALGVEFERVAGEAIDLEEIEGGARLVLSDGRTVTAQRVVLAIGNLPGEYPIPRSLPFYRSRRYVHVPWQTDPLQGIDPDAAVLLVGAGLTAVDMILQLDERSHRGTIHVLSRRGLHPFAHRPGPAYPPFLAGTVLPSTVRGLLRRVRAEIRAAAAQGWDWRPVIDAIRPQSQDLWRGFSWEERARFMRHLRPHWEVHRHRVAPSVALAIEKWVGEGRVKFHAGRLQSLVDTESGAAALFRRRGGQELVALRVAKVINCTGPRSDYSKYQHPLLINLLARGLIDHDPLALGLNALPDGEVLRYRGGPTGWLFTLGAPLKGQLWETTAVQEIRVHARELAGRLLAC